MLRRWTYVSKSALQAAQRRSEIQALTDAAIIRNAKLSVSGALIHTGEHFAQIVEGSPQAIDELIKSISRDPRHFDIVDIENCAVPGRQFAGWTMLYDGSSTWFRKVLLEALTEPRSDAAARLLRVFLELKSVGGIVA